MKRITEDRIISVVGTLCKKANFSLRRDVLIGLKNAAKKERDGRSRQILWQLLENAKIAASEKLAICQDTGLPVVFVEVGAGADISKIDLKGAINKGVARGYKEGYLRNSVVTDPIGRKGVPGFGPVIIHFDITKTSMLKITVLPKGFGSENKTQLLMFNPTAKPEDIKKFVVSCVKDAGPDACPPYVIGVGIGGTSDYAAMLSKKALLRPVNKRSKNKAVKKLEEELLKDINGLKIGPMGLGGDTTALAVNILTHPTHIAGLPVCVNISCHALRSASATI